MSKADGGPAFPGGSLRFDDGDCETPYQIGMSLRDWFAGQALAGMNANRGWNERSWKAMARDAFRAADAMLSARGVSDDQ